MALTYTIIPVFFFLLLLNSVSTATLPFQPKGIILPVTKDSSTLQHIAVIHQRTPFVAVKLTVHLGGQTLWVDCEKGYTSSSYKAVRCNSSQCLLADAFDCENCSTSSPTPKPTIGCNNNACHNLINNPTIMTSTGGEISEDVISMVSTNGLRPGQAVTVPRFIFNCAATFLTDGLASGVTGMAGLGRSTIAFPTQLAQAFSFKRQIAICLSSSKSSNGVVLFGDLPYSFLPKRIDFLKSLIYTPLIVNRFGLGADILKNVTSSEYYIGVKAIQINGKPVTVNKKLLGVDKNGFGGTKISSTVPYTILHPSIYTAVTNAFINELSNVSRVASVAPFGACFSSKNIASTPIGPAVPSIDLVLQTKRVIWKIIGANSMVQVSKDVMCLGFVDGGPILDVSIEIGAHQIEDNLLQFDLVNSRLGFSSSLLFNQTNCANLRN